MRDLMFAGVWLVLLPLCVTTAHVGVLLWTWVALLQPNELLTGFLSGVPFNKIVAAVTLALVLFTGDGKRPYLDLNLALLFLFAVAATVSWANGIVSTPDEDDLLEKLLKVLALAFVITAVMTTRHRIHLLLVVVVLAQGFLAVKEGLISLLTVGGHRIIGSASVGDNNSLATALLMIMPVVAYLIRYSAATAVKAGLWAVLGLSVVTVVMTFSRGGFIGILVLGTLTVRHSRNKAVGIGLVLLAALLIAATAPEAWFVRLNTIGSADDDSSFMGRVVAWKISLLIALDHPFFGGGMHAVQHLPVWDAYKPLVGSLGFIATPPPDDLPHAAHSIYFEVLGDLGFTGLVLFVAILAVSFRDCRRTIRLARGDASLAWAADLARALQVSLALYAVTAAALSMAYFELTYVVVALASRCCRTAALAANAARPAAMPDGAPWRHEPPARATRPARWSPATDRPSTG